MAEFELIERIRRQCRQTRADVRLGIGDDAALVEVPEGSELVVCTDTMVAGVHFPLTTAAADLGWKSLAVNLSDLAAMGATPAWATLALTLPDADRDFVEDFAQGFAELATQHALDLVGGDTTRGPLTVTVSALGLVPKGQALRRSGARIGDAVFVTGTLGDAAAALERLGRDSKSGLDEWRVADRKALLDRLNRPQPRIATGMALRGLANACIDVSDGLVADLGHVATAGEVGIEIEAALLPGSHALRASADDSVRTRLQLCGGDDYELAFTLAEERVESMRAALAGGEAGVTRIGRVVAGSGVRVLDREGHAVAMQGSGWEHFR